MQVELTLEIIRQAVRFDKSRKVLRIEGHVFLKNVAEGKTTLNQFNRNKAAKLVSLLVRRGLEIVV